MFSRKRLFIRALPGLLLGGLLSLAVYSIASATPSPPGQTQESKAHGCTVNSDAVLVLPAQGHIQCLDKTGSYMLAAGNSICNDSPAFYMVFAIPAERPDLAQYGPLYKQHGCIDAPEEGAPFKIEALPLVQDQAACQHKKGVFVQATSHEGAALLQCLQQGGLYHLVQLETVCNFLEKGDVLLSRSVTLPTGSACYKSEASSKKVYRALILALPTSSSKNARHPSLNDTKK